MHRLYETELPIFVKNMYMHRSFSIFFMAFLVVSCIRTPDTEVHYLSEIYYQELRGTVAQLEPSIRENYWVNLIDFGDMEDFNAGHIPFAENIELHFFIDSNGYIVNDGRAITQRFDDRWEFIVYSSSNDTIAYWAAKSIERLGYSRVRFYEGGLEDWQDRYGDYLHMNEAGFNSWYNTFYPFDDTLQVLVDVHPASWFSGEEELLGHIPGAVNIPISSLVDTVNGNLTLVDGGVALKEIVSGTSARIVVYDSENSREMSKAFMAAAMELGYDNLYLFPGGYDAWIANGWELEQ